jgi:septum site-determining protein MinC
MAVGDGMVMGSRGGNGLTDKQHITIKGVKEGLVFLLDDECEFDVLLSELHYKLETSHQQLLTGPLVHVHVKLGTRQASDAEKEQLVTAIRRRGNLLVQSVESDPVAAEDAVPEKDVLKTMTGDLNPGGTIRCTGDIYVLGSLRGIAHAGTEGRKDAIIAASMLRPTQLRIAEVISRPPDEWMTGDTLMEFAYLEDDHMNIDKISQLYRIRKDPIVFKGV